MRRIAPLAVLATFMTASAGAQESLVYHQYFAALRERCPAKHLEAVPPAELLDKEEGFGAKLPGRERRRLDRLLPKSLLGRIADCARRDGTGCDAAAYIKAFGRLRLSSRFAGAMCQDYLGCVGPAACRKSPSQP